MLRHSTRFLRTHFRLSPEMGKTLSKLLFHEHYRPEMDLGKVKESLLRGKLYEAKIELSWLCDFANDAEYATEADFVNAVKRSVLERVDHHKPLSYILGTQPFCSTDIRCVPPLMIPRTETEEWVWWIIQKYLMDIKDEPERFRVLDLCCGTGCIGAALLSYLPNVEVVGVDVDPLAVETARVNYAAGVQRYTARVEQEQTVDPEKPATSELRGDEILKALKNMKKTFLSTAAGDAAASGAAAGAAAGAAGENADASSSRFQVLTSDMFTGIPTELEGTFDLIMCNPPYILPVEYDNDLPRSVRDWETKLALVGDERHENDALSYFRELRDESPKWLREKPESTRYIGPQLVFELGIVSRVIRQLFQEDPTGYWKQVDLHIDRFDEPRWTQVYHYDLVSARQPTAAEESEAAEELAAREKEQKELGRTRLDREKKKLKEGDDAADKA